VPQTRQTRTLHSTANTAAAAAAADDDDVKNTTITAVREALPSARHELKI